MNVVSSCRYVTKVRSEESSVYLCTRLATYCVRASQCATIVVSSRCILTLTKSSLSASLSPCDQGSKFASCGNRAKEMGVRLIDRAKQNLTAWVSLLCSILDADPINSGVGAFMSENRGQHKLSQHGRSAMQQSLAFSLVIISNFQRFFCEYASPLSVHGGPSSCRSHSRR